ncbi:hypothetical protein KR009_009094 [Drosophila setifemur]|nr:hypothetical protein KR009_009094 [Drosophila setifemur]
MIHVGDNSWNLRIFITDQALEKTIRVRGDQHIGAIMLQLVDPENPKDWSDHALWWAARNVWLDRTGMTLDQCGVQAGILLHYTPMHKILRVQLPDLRYLDCRVDFSTKTFTAVVNLCKQLDIRYPEELSLCKLLEPEHLKRNFARVPHQKRWPITEQDGTTCLPPTFVPTNAVVHEDGGSTASLDTLSAQGSISCVPFSPQYYRVKSPTASLSPGTWGQSQIDNAPYDSSSSSLADFQENLASSPPTPCSDVRARQLRPKTLKEKARLNVGWLDSTVSLMEQGIREFDSLCLRFKYFTFLDINPKYDQVRINQLYEQAKWSILNEELDATEEETLMFAALQLQVTHQSDLQPQVVESDPDSFSQENYGDEEIDSVLDELQITLGGPNGGGDSTNITIPDLSDYLWFRKPRKFNQRGYKRYYFTYRDLHLHLFKSAEESCQVAPAIRINLEECVVTPDVNVAQRKYAIRLKILNGSNSEISVRCENEQQFAKWMAACRLAAKQRFLADSTYESAVDGILSLLQMQRPFHGIRVNIDATSVVAKDYLSPRILRKLSNKAVQRILEANSNACLLNATESKLKYIQGWQSLLNFGVSFFIVKFQGHTKKELLGMTHDRIMRMDLGSGDHIMSWRYSKMKAWQIHRERNLIMLQLEDKNVVFSCQSANCDVVHEFIGGYIFMSMRSKSNNQTQNEELFKKLVGGCF